MPKKKKNKKQNLSGKKKTSFSYPFFTSRLRRLIILISFLVFALIVFLSFFQKAGKGGQFLFDFFYFLIGKTTYFLPLLFVTAALLLFKPQKKRVTAPVFLGVFLVLMGISGLFQLLAHDMERTGGILGYLTSWPLLNFFGMLVAVVLFCVLIVVGVLIFWEFLPKKTKTEKKKPESERKEKEAFKQIPIPTPQIKIPEFKIKKLESLKPQKIQSLTEKKEKIAIEKKEKITRMIKGDYSPPPVSFLSHSRERPETSDIEYASLVIKKTLANFGIPVEMGEVFIGPTVTQYTLKPAEGVKLSKIVSLTNDLALALAAHPIRIEAPIPGKSLVGIEVPNKRRVLVSLRELIESQEFQKNTSPLFFPLGKDVAGGKVFADIEKMPHLLVAGSTGSGKTVFLQSLIVSLLFRNSPQIMRLILVDPKRVEFPVYQNLPHLLAPVIFDAAKTVNVLNWLIGEMERRFRVLSEVRVRDITSFNELIAKNNRLRDDYGVMPYIVLIIDELADLMAAKGREVESAIVRLSQLARAVGIHLVVATQRPSVDVLTGLIKANFTSRVAFQVASQVDSRTILDMAGAETLLGRGDMLFLSSEYGKPRRVQAPFVSQPEVKKVVNFIIKENTSFEEGREIEQSLKESLERTESSFPGDSSLEEEDPLYEEAKKVVQQYKRASASLLQRRLKIGYARAARLLDMLEERGIVGPADGARPRQVYINEQEDSHFDSESNSEHEWHKV